MTDRPHRPLDPVPAPGTVVLSRRRLIALLAGGGLAVGATGGLLGAEVTGRQAPPTTAGPTTSGPPSTPTGHPVTGGPTPNDPLVPVHRRRLVVVELQGGNDGLATVVSLDQPILNRLRPDLGPRLDELVVLDDRHGLHPALGELSRRWPLAVVTGLGSRTPDGSHFEMQRRWWTGDPEGTAALRTGYLGRVCDELGDGRTPAGAAIGSPSPFLEAARPGSTTTVADPDTVWFLTDDDDWARALRRALPALADGAPARVPAGAGAWYDRARQGLLDVLNMADLLDTSDSNVDTGGYPDTTLGLRLALTARLLAADPGLKVVHVAFDGFDTHADQADTHPALLDELGRCLVAFRDHLDRLGLGGSTLVATTSEFGRRPEQNGDGTDHGTAAPALLSGPVNAGVVGEDPRLDRLDADGNLVATLAFDAYLALLGETWLGVPVAGTLPGRPTPPAGVVVT